VPSARRPGHFWTTRPQYSLRRSLPHLGQASFASPAKVAEATGGRAEPMDAKAAVIPSGTDRIERDVELKAPPQ